MDNIYIYVTSIPIRSRSSTHTHMHSLTDSVSNRSTTDSVSTHKPVFPRARPSRPHTWQQPCGPRARIINLIINLGCSCRRPKTTNPNCRNKSGGPHRGLVKKKSEKNNKTTYINSAQRTCGQLIAYYNIRYTDR